MKIIQTYAREDGSRPAIQNGMLAQVPPGYSLIPDDFDDSVFYEHNGFVELEVDEDNILTDMTPNTEAWEAWKASLPEPEPSGEYVSDAEALSILLGGVENV